MYKEASKTGLRILTNRGPLSVEQLWSLPITELDTLAVSLDEAYKKSGDKSFLVRRSTKNKLVKLQFDIVLDILTTKVEEAEALRVTQENREHNKKIDSIIAEKQEESLKGKSISELNKMRK